MLMKSDEEIAEVFIKAQGSRLKAQVSEKDQVELTEEEWDRIVRIVALVKERAEFVKDIWAQAWFFFEAPATYDEGVVKKRWSPEMPLILKDIISLIGPETDEYEALIKGFIADRNLNMGNVMNILRLCLVGSSMGPGVFDIMELLGPAEVIARIEKAIETIG
jgi:glutamyl-tRNA synthetase